ncbi:MAG: hypothetical protein IJ638_04230 [Alphaproteobacteria bacterium]|nr:hypothetical protein [Alphaproteobacteria bacterium]
MSKKISLLVLALIVGISSGVKAGEIPQWIIEYSKAKGFDTEEYYAKIQNFQKSCLKAKYGISTCSQLECEDVSTREKLEAIYLNIKKCFEEDDEMENCRKKTKSQHDKEFNLVINYCWNLENFGNRVNCSEENCIHTCTDEFGQTIKLRVDDNGNVKEVGNNKNTTEINNKENSSLKQKEYDYEKKIRVYEVSAE